MTAILAVDAGADWGGAPTLPSFPRVRPDGHARPHPASPRGIAGRPGASSVFGAACFLVPLWGIHGRLELEKERLLLGVETRANVVASELCRRVDAGDFESTKTIADGYARVAATRERVERLSTWPWPPQLLRGFVSALLLPVAVYLLTRLTGTLGGG